MSCRKEGEVMSNFKYFRLKKHLSQADLAKELGITTQAMSNYERGTRTADYDTLKKLAQILDTTIDDLLSDEVPAEPVNIEDISKLSFDEIASSFVTLTEDFSDDEKKLISDMVKLISQKKE